MTRLLLLALVLTACAPVHAWERGRLQSAVMQPPDALETAAEGHVLGTREGVLGADGGGGASCGCN